MEHIAFSLKIDPEDEEEYKRRHQNVFPELEALFAEFGIRRYHIYHHEGTLFAYMEVEDYAKAMGRLADHQVNQKWQRHMSDLLKAWEDGSKKKMLSQLYQFVKTE